MTRLRSLVSKMFNLRGLLWTGAITHVVATITVYLIGRFRLLPQLVDANGMLVGDAQTYLDRLLVINQQISDGNFYFLISKTDQIHIRIFAPFFKVFSSIFGANIFCFELINILVFVTILFLIYKIGENCFNAQTGLIAALTVNFLPSFLIHTTQPLRDQFYILLLLAIVFVFLRIFDKQLSVKGFMSYLVGSLALFLMIWLVREGAILLYISIILLALFLMIIKNLKNLLSVRFNLLLALLLLIFVGATPYIFTPLLPQKALTSIEKFNREKNFTIRQKSEKDPLTARINVIRFRWNNSYSGQSGSDLDRDVLFESWGQVLAYLPRALAIGFFAPFPDMWLAEGKFYGGFGRLAAGLETLFMYFVYALAIVTIYYYSRSIKTWFLASICVVGVLSLGLVVVNIGTLYRTRYVLWLFLIILGTKGFLMLRERINPTDLSLIPEN